MQRFEYQADLAEGAYGCVWLCLDRETGQHVAMKRFKEAHTDSDVMRLALREVRMLKAAQGQPNVVKIVEAFRSKSGRVYIAMEYVEKTLTYFLRKYHGKGMPPILAKWFAYQMLQAISHLHNSKMMHRDLKPANLLITNDYQLKLCDFGFARNLHGQREIAEYTTYVVTRWYRPPEILVSDVYGPKVDMWAFGCLLCEMMAGRPLLPGRNSANQLWLTMRALGPLPTHQSLLMSTDKLYTNLVPPSNEEYLLLEDKFPHFPPDLMHLLRACLAVDPDRRMSAEQALAHPYWSDMPSIHKAMTKSALPPREFWESVELAWLGQFEPQPQAALVPHAPDNASRNDVSAARTCATVGQPEHMKDRQQIDVKGGDPDDDDDAVAVDVAMNIARGPAARTTTTASAVAQASHSVHGGGSSINTPAAPRASRMQAAVADSSRHHLSNSNANLNCMLDALAHGALGSASEPPTQSSLLSAQDAFNRPTASSLCMFLDSKQFLDHNVQGSGRMLSTATSGRAPTMEAPVVAPPRVSMANGEGLNFPIETANNASLLVVHPSTLYQRCHLPNFVAAVSHTAATTGQPGEPSLRKAFTSCDGLRMNSCPRAAAGAKGVREVLSAANATRRSEEAQCFAAGSISGPAGSIAVHGAAPRCSSPSPSPRSLAGGKVGGAGVQRLDRERNRTQSRLSMDAANSSSHSVGLTRSNTVNSSSSGKAAHADTFLPSITHHGQGVTSSTTVTSAHDMGSGHALHRSATVRSGLGSSQVYGGKRVIAPCADVAPHAGQGPVYPRQMQSLVQQHADGAHGAPGVGVDGKKYGLADRVLSRMREFLGGK